MLEELGFRVQKQNWVETSSLTKLRDSNLKFKIVEMI